MKLSDKKRDQRSFERYKQRLDSISQATKNGLPAYESELDKKKRVEATLNDYSKFFEYYLVHYCTDEKGHISRCADFHVDFAHYILKNPISETAQKWGRGLAKSVHSDVGIPLWLWARGETIFEVIVGNNETSARNLLDDVRAEFEMNHRLITDFGEQKLIGKWEEGDFQSRDGKYIGRALGMGQNVRGLRIGARRPNYIVCDDLEDSKTVKNPQRQNEISDWIIRALLPTMTSAHRRTLIIANNHFHPQTIQSLCLLKNKHWKEHRIDACDKVTFQPRWPERDTKEKYLRLAKNGLLAFLSEYCNEPHIEGSIFTSDQIHYAPSKTYPKAHEFEMTVGYWDVAYGGTKTSDFNAIVIFGVKDGKYYHLGSFCKQSKMEEALIWLAGFIKKRRTTKELHLYFESQFWNDAVKSTIRDVERREQVTFNFNQSDKPSGNKYDRILTLQPYFQKSEIIFSDADRSSSDAQVGIAQLMGIEPGYKTHDDWPDALEGCIKILERHSVSSGWEEPIYPRSNKSRYRF
jgi:phage terminase large subunit-like protein